MDDITAPYAVTELRQDVPLGVRVQARVAAKTDVGRVREHNEDKNEFYVPSDDRTLATRGQIYLVCDGMGGHSAGQLASELATKTFIDVYLNHPSDDPEIAARAATLAANRFVRDVGLAMPKYRGMGTTLSALLLIQDRAMVVQVGDSRVYRCRHGATECLTTDHTWVEEMVKNNVMSRPDAELHPNRHVITRAIGTEGDVEPDIFWFDLLEGDTFLLCSDGLTNHVSDAELAERMPTMGPSELCWTLVQMALAAGGSDNCTALVVAVDRLDSQSG